MDDLNDDQKRAVFMAKMGKNLFITGPAGAGKTHVLRMIVRELEQKKKKVQVTASTGMAASLLVGISKNGSRTLHSYMGFRATDQSKTVQEVVDRIRFIKPLRKNLSELDVLIVDECSMIGLDCFKKMDAVLRKVRGAPMKPFGGVQLILTGDFFQLGPVQSRVELQIFEDSLWNEAIHETVHLSMVYRQTNADFLGILAKLRLGQVDETVVKLLADASKNKLENENGIKPTVLYSCNADVDRLNRQELDKLPGQMYTFRAIDNIVHGEHHLFSLPSELHLKKDAQVMVTMNLPMLGLVNGSRGVVVSITDEERIQIRLLSGRTVTMPRCAQEYEDADMKKCTRSQFPLKLAWAVTIHKCQGQTIDYLIVDLDRVFAEGQAYTAISRGTSLENMIVRNFNPRCVMVSHAVKKHFHQEEKDDEPVQKRIKIAIE